MDTGFSPVLISTIASSAISFLIPYLKSLADEFAKGIGKEAGTKITDALIDKNKKLYDVVKQKFNKEKATSELIENFEKNPTEAKTQSVVEYHLGEFLKSDLGFAGAVSSLVKELTRLQIDQANTNIAETNKGFQAGSISGTSTNIGNVIILDSNSDAALAKLSNIIGDKKLNEQKEKISLNLIEVLLKSNRFQRTIKFPVDKGISVSDFLDLVIEKLSLPQTKSFPELMIRFEFSYSLSYQGKLLPNARFSRLGIIDGEKVELLVQTIWVDEIEEKELEEATQGNIQYGNEQIQELVKRDMIKRTRGRVTEAFIESLADATFAFVDSSNI